jgi:hypothetical protein
MWPHVAWVAAESASKPAPGAAAWTEGLWSEDGT